MKSHCFMNELKGIIALHEAFVCCLDHNRGHFCLLLCWAYHTYKPRAVSAHR